MTRVSGCLALARRRVKRPVPQDMSSTTSAPGPLSASPNSASTSANSSSAPGKPLRLKLSRHPRSYRNDTKGLERVLLHALGGTSADDLFAQFVGDLARRPGRFASARSTKPKRVP